MDATYRQLEISARGERLDQYLTGDPEISFFKHNTKRYYPFARNTKVLQFDTNADFGKTAQLTFPRYGDLIGKLSLEIDLPTLSQTDGGNVGYCNNIGHAIIDWIELEIGGNQIVRIHNEFLYIDREITEDNAQKETHYELTQYYSNMTTQSFTGGKIIVPLNFWFCKTPSQFLPLSAICRHDVIFRIKLNPFSQLWISDDSNPPDGTYNISRIQLLTDYYVLDQSQKKYFAPIYNKSPNGTEDIALYPPKMTYRIQQVQRIKVSIPAGQTTYKLDLDSINFTVSHLVWVLRRNDVSNNNDWFNFTDVLSGTSTDPLVNAQIYFGEKERTDELSAKVLRMLEPFNFLGYSSDDYIYCYFFNLYANNKQQPSGTVNFSFLSDTNIVLKMKSGLPEMELHLFAINYNVLNVDKGQCWLQYQVSN